MLKSLHMIIVELNSILLNDILRTYLVDYPVGQQHVLCIVRVRIGRSNK